MAVLIVDAFNVLHAAPAAGLGRLDAPTLKHLIAQSRWASGHTVLVYDGRGGRSAPARAARASLSRPIDAGLALGSRESGISEVFAGAGGEGERGGGERGMGIDADTVIESLIEREDGLGRGRQTVVVSSDKRLRAAAAGARARTLTSEAFLKSLADDARKRIAGREKGSGGRPRAATDEGVEAGRTEFWLREFGVGDRPPSPPFSPGRPEQHCGQEINPDDVDMGEILRGHDGLKPPAREEHDDDDRRERNKRAGKGRR